AACLRSVPRSSAMRSRIGSRRSQRIESFILRYKSPMRRLVIAACLLGCSEWRLKPTFPAEAAGRPVINEQAILGLTDAGDAAVAQFVDAEGAPPQLALLFFDRAGGPSRRDRAATEATARSVSQEVRANGRRRVPVLAAALAARWPEAMARAS